MVIPFDCPGVGAGSGSRAESGRRGGRPGRVRPTSPRTRDMTGSLAGSRRTRSIRPAMTAISASFMPRVVRAGVPMRMPLVTKGLWVSNGMLFLLTVMPASSRASSASLPVMLCARSGRPASGGCPSAGDQPEARAPPAPRPAPGRWRRSAAGRPRSRGCRASPKATALAAMTCISGPPWMPGKTALSMALACSSRQRINPPRGPRRVLWVVVVTNARAAPGWDARRRRPGRRCGPCRP